MAKINHYFEFRKEAKMTKSKYDYMAFIVNVKKGTVEEVYGAIKQGQDYNLGERADDDYSGKKIAVVLGNTNAEVIETFYGEEASPGCRYVKVGSTWRRVCN